MKKIYLLLLAVSGCISSYAGYNPLSLTGFNEDVIANGTGTVASSISANLPGAFDNGNPPYALVAEDFSYNGSTPMYYLPTGGVMSSILTPGLTYQLADYSSNNTLYLVNANDSGVLSLTTPQSEGALYVLGTTGSGQNGPALCNATLYFSDGTTQTFTGLSYPDWYQGTAATQGIGRVSLTDNSLDGDSQNPHMFEVRIDLDPANYIKTIDSISIKKTNSNGDLGIFAITGVSVCSGMPVAGTVVATPSHSCGAFNTLLSLAGSTAAAGLTYQWQSSTDSVNWTNVPTATSSTYSAYVTTNTYYRAFVTCGSTSNTDSTGGVLLTVINTTPVNATLPYVQDFENWQPACYNFDRPDTSWLLNPSTGDLSWRREDQGSDASWDNIADGAYNPPSSHGAHSARLHVADDYGNGDMDLHLDLSAAGTKQIDFDYINPDQFGYNYITVYESDDGINFTQLQQYSSQASVWTHAVLTTTSVSPTAVLRFEGHGDYEGTDLGIDNIHIAVQVPCSGTPLAGPVSASQITGCSAFTSNLSIPDTALSGLVYQWQSSDDGINWTDVAGANDLSYSSYVTSNIYYRDSVTCTNGNADSITAPVELQIVVPAASFASLPYFQGFENWMGTCFNYDRPDTSWLNSPSSGNNSWRRDDQGADAGWGGPAYGIYSPVSTEGAHSARFHANDNFNGPGDLDMYVDLSAAGTKAIQFDYNNESGTSGDVTLTVELSEDSGYTFTPIGTYVNSTASWTPIELYTNSVAAHGVIRFEGDGEFSNYDLGLDSVNVYVLPPCSGTPNVTSIVQSNALGCTAYTDTLSLGAPVTASGLTYQWQSSPDGTTWTSIAGATDMSAMENVSTTTEYFRLIVTCSNSSASDTTASITAGVTHLTGTASVPYFQGFENWIGACYSNDLPDSNWINSPNYGNDSWRRDDQGSDAGWSNTFSGDYTPTSTEGNNSARFHTYSTSNGDVGNMDLHIDLSAAGPKAIQFDYINMPSSTTTNDDYLTVELSEDTGATWTTLGVYNTENAWTSEYLFTNSVAPNAILRFMATSDGGQTDIGLDSLNIEMATPCSGIPVAGPINVSQYTGCSTFSPTLSLSVSPTTADLTYQWQSSTNNINWTTVSPADTTATYIPTVSSSVMYYRAYETCLISNNTDTASSVELQIVTPAASYAALPYFQGFENWEGTCFLYDRPDTNWLNGPSSGNNSWRRDDQGTDASWTYPTDGTYYPTSSELNHSARFHSYENGNSPGDLDLYVNLDSVGTKAIQFDYFNQSGTSGDVTLTVELSENGGSTFTTIGTYSNSNTSWTPVELYTNSTAANAVIRFEGNGDYSPYDLGLDSVNVYVLPACSGIPNITSISQSDAGNCVAYYDTLSPGAAITASGYTYQWQSSPDNTTWTSVANDTNMTSVQYVTTGSEYFRLIITCSHSGMSDTTSSAMASVTHFTSVANLPYFQGFENWIGACYTYDLPDSNWTSTPNHGNDSWRRNDQGSDAGWTYANDGTYSPTSSEGVSSARFHVYEAPYGTTGDLDLNVNLDAPGTKNIYFDVLNNSSSGDPFLTVELSVDSGATFTTLNTYYPASGTTWQPQMLTTTAVSPHAILRFEGYSDFSDNDMGIDSLYISGPPCDTVLNLAASNITATGADINWDSISSITGYVYALDQNATASGTGTLTTVNSYGATGLTPGTTYYFHILTNCAPGDSSAWETISFTTLDTCAPPSNITVPYLITDTAVVTWTGVSGVSGYVVAVDQSSGVPTGVPTFTTFTTDTITGLADSANYCIHVRSVCAPGDSSSWVTYCFNTPGLGVPNIIGSDFSISASPNPAANKVNIIVNGTQYGKSYLRLSDVTGKVIQMIPVNGDKVTLDISTIASGIYFINYVDDVHNEVIKLVKDE